MRLPDRTASVSRHVSFARYAKRRCTLAGFTDLAAAVEAPTAALVAVDRALQDAEGPQQDAVADRDAADEALDEEARRVRQQLANRSLDAARQAPYTLVFHAGIHYYVRAPLGQEVTRYLELCDRLDENLPRDDPLRVEGVPKLKGLVAAWSSTRDEVEAARRVLSRARTAREAAVAAWDDQITHVYGALIQRLGKKKAERFFQRTRSATKVVEPAPVEVTAPE